jgi:hypothetical protein
MIMIRQSYNRDVEVDTDGVTTVAGAGNKRAGGAQYYRNDDSSLSLRSEIEYIRWYDTIMTTSLT